MKDRHPYISIIIRTFNEEKFLAECLSKVKKQDYDGEIEIIIVDSGSSDRTLEIAHRFGCKIIEISQKDFTFGRSLNFGCEISIGDILVLLSAHCIPTNSDWLSELIHPIVSTSCEYVYGRQIPRYGVSKYSEGMVFRKYFPTVSAIPQVGYFCNNANSAITREAWLRHGFNEKLTGLEDIDLAKRLVGSGGSVAYISTSIVEHIHEENWKRIKVRYEREAVALAEIEPYLNLNILQAIKMFLMAVNSDLRHCESYSAQRILQIILYRGCQYWGSYVGSRASKLRITRMKREYFYPKATHDVVKLGERYEHDSASADESP